jgi:hypothetical protein
MSRLKVVHERKICELMPCHQPNDSWEASGVLMKDRHYFVVFDDRRQIAHIAGDLHRNDSNALFGAARADYGYEGITYNAAKQRFYLLVEARKHTKGCYRATIFECDNDFKYIKERPADFIFESGIRGSKPSFTCGETARTICWRFAKATSANAAPKAGRAVDACCFSRKRKNAGGTF